MENLPSHSGLYKIVEKEHGVEALKTVRHYVNIAQKLTKSCPEYIFTYLSVKGCCIPQPNHTFHLLCLADDLPLRLLAL